MPPLHTSVLGQISVERFLKDHWQKRPLVVRGAFPNLKDPLSPDELAGLSCESHVDSRLVMERGGTKPWQVIRGPQRAKDLRKLQHSHWTLLLEGVDRHSEEIAALASAFSFLPKWRMDDVMVSLAPIHGTVGAHIDSYDVFLIQGQGMRRWEVDNRSTAAYRPGLDLRILKQFHPQNSWVLQPGDMLYVPPGTGHRGTTVKSGADVALTYSVGFRAPCLADILSTLLTQALSEETPRLFSDRGRIAVEDGGELSKRDLVELKRFLRVGLNQTEGDAWPLAAGEAVTGGGRALVPSTVFTSRSVVHRLFNGATISPKPGARLAWTGLDRGRAALFVNGESRILPRAQAFGAPFLCGKVSPGAGRRLSANADLVALVLSLLRAGVLVLNESPQPVRHPRRLGS